MNLLLIVIFSIDLCLIAFIIDKAIEYKGLIKSVADSIDNIRNEITNEENRILKLGISALHKQGKIDYPNRDIIAHVIRTGEYESDLIEQSIKEINEE